MADLSPNLFYYLPTLYYYLVNYLKKTHTSEGFEHTGSHHGPKLLTTGDNDKSESDYLSPDRELNNATKGT